MKTQNSELTFGKHRNITENSQISSPEFEKVIEKIAKEKNLSMVIQSNQTAQIVLYATAEADLTEDVVKLFDKEKQYL